jgi:hypothetical protein
MPPPVAPDLAEAICSVAQCSRCHVYLFFVQGYDPVDCACLEELKDTVQALGFPNAWYGAACYVSHFKKELARIQEDDPQARFVLVGYKHGVSAAAEMARSVGTQGITFELMVCLGTQVEKPCTVSRMLTVSASSCECGADDEHHINTWSHKLPMHPETVEIVSRELLSVAASIPSVGDMPPRYVPDNAPTPRPVMPPADVTAQDDWDFLKPASVERHTVMAPDTIPELKQPSPRRQEAQQPKRAASPVSRSQ